MSEKVGCLGLLLWLLGVPLPSRPALPYRLRDDFLSRGEAAFCDALRAAAGEDYLVCPKVNLGDLFFVVGGEAEQSHRNRIDRKHVDFVLVDLDAYRPVIAIELDDISHASEARRDRDRFVDSVFVAAGLPLLRIRAARRYDAQEIRRQILASIAAGVGVNPAPYGAGNPAPLMADEQHATPSCPKCNVPLVRRTAARGQRAGREFWGCANYPRCRHTQPLRGGA